MSIPHAKLNFRNYDYFLILSFMLPQQLTIFQVGVGHGVDVVEIVGSEIIRRQVVQRKSDEISGCSDLERHVSVHRFVIIA